MLPSELRQRRIQRGEQKYYGHSLCQPPKFADRPRGPIAAATISVALACMTTGCLTAVKAKHSSSFRKALLLVDYTKWRNYADRTVPGALLVVLLVLTKVRIGIMRQGPLACWATSTLSGESV